MEIEVSGNRQIMEQPYHNNLSAILALMMAELAEGKGRFLPQLINGVFFSCEMTSWCYSAHLEAGQLSKRSLPEYEDIVIDIESADAGMMMAWAHYFFHDEFDKFNPEISKRLKHEIGKRIIDPFNQLDRYWWMALRYQPGWTVNNS